MQDPRATPRLIGPLRGPKRMREASGRDCARQGIRYARGLSAARHAGRYGSRYPGGGKTSLAAVMEAERVKAAVLAARFRPERRPAGT